uniref:Dihydropteridine reductase n=1 Tax=Rhabditophanes sp. KR3021 TaxID=114890 RepID=A0AC35U9J6_9BILA
MSAGKVLVYGGRGSLGSHVIEAFKTNNYYTISLDLHANDAADANVIVDGSADWEGQHQKIEAEINKLLEGAKLDGIFCVAGGWAGGNASTGELIKSADLMWKQSVWSSTISAHLGSKYLKDGGILQLTGAAAALEGTPGMIGYGMAKAAVHHLVKSLAGQNSGLPKDCTTLAILPVTLDTPMNRKWMPKADFSSWTTSEFIGEKFLEWSKNADSRPASGSLIKLVTKEGKTELINV